MAGFALLGLAPVAALTFSAITLSTHAVRQEVRSKLRASDVASARFVDEQIASLGRLTSSYARRPLLARAMGNGDPSKRDLPTVQGQLADYIDSRPGIKLAFLLDPKGRLIAITPPSPELVGKDFRFRDYFAGVASTGQTYVSEAYEFA
ncbi:MAG: PDC sensor domain-containing protein, partial [Acidimicrobiales bacterium]